MPTRVGSILQELSQRTQRQPSDHPDARRPVIFVIIQIAVVGKHSENIFRWTFPHRKSCPSPTFHTPRPILSSTPPSLPGHQIDRRGPSARSEDAHANSQANAHYEGAQGPLHETLPQNFVAVEKNVDCGLQTGGQGADLNCGVGSGI